MVTEQIYPVCSCLAQFVSKHNCVKQKKINFVLHLLLFNMNHQFSKILKVLVVLHIYLIN